MRVETLNYSQYTGKPDVWTLEQLTLGNVNLLVGKNASGKTRALNVLKNLAERLSGKGPELFSEGDFDITFNDNGTPLRYTLTCHEGNVVTEKFARAGRVLLDRSTGGKGHIFAEEQEKQVLFQTPETQLAAVSRQDSIQHRFLEPLRAWGESLLHIAFGTALGRTHLAVVVEDPEVGLKFDPRETEKIVPIYRRGVKDYGERFKEAIVQDMAAIGYDISEVGVRAPQRVTVTGPVPAGEIVALYVQEKDLEAVTEQIHMSQGMFRALSVIIQMNYSEMASVPSCVLIDDVGEGLDFERSSSLIRLLVKKAERSSVQLVMATNDRFVMNNVPLTAWSLLDRAGPHCRVYNYKNSKDVFDRFRFTGLNNFDFFASDFLKGPGNGNGDGEGKGE